MDKERIYLKLLSENDVDETYLSWHLEDHTKFYSASGRKFSIQSLREEIRSGRQSETLFIYGVYHRNNDKLIGNIKLGPITKNHAISDLIVFIGDKDYLGQGLSVDIIKAANKIAFQEYGIRKLFGGMYRGNVASVKAYLKADWVIEGVLKGQYLSDGKQEDRILVACFNPDFFDMDDVANSSYQFEEIYH